MEIQFPAKLEFLFKPARYKCAHGGRGSAKSWSFARALLIQAAQKPMRILCTREVQKSIKDSVHKLLSDQIQALGLGQFYEVLETQIRGVNGSEFAFAGLASHTIESIKSFEGVDVVWIEEAQVVSKRSWDVLVPTIRKPGSEIWVTMNPVLETDDSYVRFVSDPPAGCVSVQVNYSDNPWFPDVLEAERLHAKETMKSADYMHIWEGACKPAVDGAIYFDEIANAERDKRICNVPYDPSLKVHAVFDLGWNDAMTVVLVQRHISEIRVIDYMEDTHKTLDWYSAELKKKNYNWGKLFLPHDGETKDYKYGKSAQQMMRDLGWEVVIVPRETIEGGIKKTRTVFSRCYFDKTKTARLIECLKRYRRNIGIKTNEPGEPLHDEYSHGADAFRYMAQSADKMTNEAWKPLAYKPNGVI